MRKDVSSVILTLHMHTTLYTTFSYTHFILSYSHYCAAEMARKDLSFTINCVGLPG